MNECFYAFTGACAGDVKRAAGAGQHVGSLPETHYCDFHTAGAVKRAQWSHNLAINITLGQDLPEPKEEVKAA